MATTVPSTPEAQEWTEWVAASATRNFFSDDPLLDWLAWFERDSEGHRMSGFCHGFVQDHDPSYGEHIPETSLADFLFKQGRSFEARVLELVNTILTRHDLETARQVARQRGDARSRERYEETLELMQGETPVIYQAVLWNAEDMTYGSPDLLVRADLLDLLVPDSASTDELDRLGRNYVVVDVKFKNLHLNSFGELDGTHKKNIAQLCLYNRALGMAQDEIPEAAYILGRGWEKGQERGTSCLSRLGRVSMLQPQYRKPPIDWYSRTQEALEWLRKMRCDGHRWSPAPFPTHPEMRPNMKNREDSPWHRAKGHIAEVTGDLTSLWQVGAATRDEFWSAHGITHWSDPRVTGDSLGLKGSYAPRANEILEVNRNPDAPLILPPRVETERHLWGTPDAVEFFVDFETTSDLDDDFSKLPEKGGMPMIFMVGCGHYEADRWVFRCFVAMELTAAEELRILKEWEAHMESVRERLAPDLPSPKVFHWSPAEDSTLTKAYNSAKTRHGDETPDVNWYDFLNRVVKPNGSTDCVAVRGSFGFGLKAVGKAMYKLGLIETNWDDGPTDGAGAMAGAWWCYREAAAKGVDVMDVTTPLRNGKCRELFKEICHYNEVDCRVMAEVIRRLRTGIRA